MKSHLHKLFTSGRCPFIWQDRIYTPNVSSVKQKDNPEDNLTTLATEVGRARAPLDNHEMQAEDLIRIASFARRGLVKELQKVWYSRSTGYFMSTDLQTVQHVSSTLYKINQSEIFAIDAYMLESSLKSLSGDKIYIDIDKHHLYISGHLWKSQVEILPLYAVPIKQEQVYGPQLMQKLSRE